VTGYEDYSCARDLLEAARDAAREAERTRRVLSGMEGREGVRAQSYEPHGRSGHRTDVMAAVDERLDYEERMRRRVNEDYALVDLACNVIYGRDDQMTGGVCALLGSAYADALWWRYCAGATWADVARGCRMSERWCRRAVETALETIDAFGMRRVAERRGTAEG